VPAAKSGTDKLQKFFNGDRKHYPAEHRPTYELALLFIAKVHIKNVFGIFQQTREKKFSRSATSQESPFLILRPRSLIMCLDIVYRKTMQAKQLNSDLASQPGPFSYQFPQGDRNKHYLFLFFFHFSGKCIVFQ
jgi:hypothetical protein